MTQHESLPQVKDCPECHGEMFLQVQFFLAEDGYFESVNVWVCPSCDYEEDLEYS